MAKPYKPAPAFIRERYLTLQRLESELKEKLLDISRRIEANQNDCEHPDTRVVSYDSVSDTTYIRCNDCGLWDYGIGTPAVSSLPNNK